MHVPGLEERVEALSREVLMMRATWGDSVQLSRQLLATAKQLVLVLERLVETLEGPTGGSA